MTAEAFTLQNMQTAFGTGLVLGAAFAFVLGILLGISWATLLKKPRGDPQ